MRVYYLQAEYEPNKHRIMKVYSEWVDRTLPEDKSRTTINVPYSVIELDERYNRVLAEGLLRNARGALNLPLPDRYYVDGSGNLIEQDTDTVVYPDPNPEREAYKLSQLYGMSQAQLETYINNNVTTLALAKEFLKKLSAAVLYLVKQTKLDE